MVGLGQRIIQRCFLEMGELFGSFFYLFVVVWVFLFVYEISQKKANLFHMATYVQYVALNQVGINWSLNKKCHS